MAASSVPPVSPPPELTAGSKPDVSLKMPIVALPPTLEALQVSGTAGTGVVTTGACVDCSPSSEAHPAIATTATKARQMTRRNATGRTPRSSPILDSPFFESGTARSSLTNSRLSVSGSQCSSPFAARKSLSVGVARRAHLSDLDRYRSQHLEWPSRQPAYQCL